MSTRRSLDRRTGLIYNKAKKKLQEVVTDNYDLVVEKNLLSNDKGTKSEKSSEDRTKAMSE
ncbi:hypothetical protein QOZ83_04000 [Romboutsia sedimentorum]|uniref:hypothetical protein n=1 Tax=Romboutsia sedimentorum TaxID=1368474 RepID=UPI0024DE377E|nr:hypothetical protein [Romboutsia sedimentorum]MDK2585013.1 hypothetical protein [Romboutsia sedimentorum]